jgi:glucose/arabinose dehydrogenase
MYVAIGSTCNICESSRPMRCDHAVRRRREERTPVLSGLRNAVGMALNPTTRQIWVTQHERYNIRPDHGPAA